MARHVRIRLERSGVEAVARLLDDRAPQTASAVWENLPVEGDVYHGKWAGKELYTLAPAFEELPPAENATVTPIPGDVCFFYVSPHSIDLPADLREAHPDGLVDLAVFYGRNSLLLAPDGFMPGNVFARVEQNLDGFADECARVFREGYADETFVYERAEDYEA